MASDIARARTRELGRNSEIGVGGERLYQKVARQLVDAIRDGTYAVGDRLPAERELAAAQGVSRPAVREAILALEVLGLVKVRIGSGAYVVAVPGEEAEAARFSVSAFELMEARMLIEGEAAALAALHISAEEIEELDRLVELIAAADGQPEVSETHDKAFHLQIAKATRNKAMEQVVSEMWEMRSQSPECALLLEMARSANVEPVVEEHSAIVAALRSGQADRARSAMRAHLSAVIEHLLFGIEEKAVKSARAEVASTRRRFLNFDQV